MKKKQNKKLTPEQQADLAHKKKFSSGEFKSTVKTFIHQLKIFNNSCRGGKLTKRDIRNTAIYFADCAEVTSTRNRDINVDSTKDDKAPKNSVKY